MRRAALLLACVVAGLAPGAGGAATPVTRHAVPGVGLSLAIPSTWRAYDYRDVVSAAALERLATANPSLASLFRAIRDPRSGVRFFAADPATDSGFATNVNVVVEKVPAGTTAVVYAQSAARQLATLPVRALRTAPVRLPAGPAVQLRYRIPLSLGSGRSILVATQQYALVHGTAAIVVTYTTLASKVSARTATFAASARSIRLAR